MPILIALALVPTLSFYLYVLAQFCKEASRRRAAYADKPGHSRARGVAKG